MSDITWTNGKRKLSELIPWERNPRQIKAPNVKRLQESLAEFGQVEPIAIGPDNELYNGHQRLKSWLTEFGDIEIDVRIASRPLSEREREKLTVFLHKGATGEFDFDVLANEFEVPDLLEWGFSEFDLQINMPNDVVQWRAEEKDDFYANPEGDGIKDKAGYRLSSMWYDIPNHPPPFKYMLELPPRKDVHDGATVKAKYSRTSVGACERIVKTYMRPGDRFFEMCCGWMTFSSTAKYFGFSGRGGDIWDVSIEFCRQQIKAMPGDGIVDVVFADCRDTKEPDGMYDFVHSNPPFFSLEPYGESGEDLSSLGSYDLWLLAMGNMGREAERILKPGGLANFVINDYRKDGVVVPMHADFMNSILSVPGLVLHDFVVSEVNSQAIRFRKQDFDLRRTVKCHEYVITFRKPDK